MPFTKKKIIAGNWKMNGLKESAWAVVNALTARFDQGIDAKNFEMIICPPATLISEVGQMIEGYPIRLGAQNCNDHAEGAYTGEISPAMLRDLGCRFVILGHSERRAYYGETSGLVAAKAAAALGCGLVPIICIGETLEEKEAGRAAAVIEKQFSESLPAAATTSNVIIAYEPVWAIGTGRRALAKDIVEIHSLIRKACAERFGTDDINILYGGSVKADNAAEIFSIADVDGALVGGASLKADEFWGIAAAA